jgi:ligand-binding SRPBCC domain-containing protein
MYVYTLDCELITHQSIESVFKVFEDPYNLAKITPANLSFRVISKEHATMRKGAEIAYNIRWLGVSLYWKTLVLEYQPPFYSSTNSSRDRTAVGFISTRLKPCRKE